jgi:hypothetical protein
VSELPRLFYVKGVAGFWYDGGHSRNRFAVEGLNLIGLGFLLLAIGLRRGGVSSAVSSGAGSRGALGVQLLGILALAILWNTNGFGPVLFVWTWMLVVALIRPYGQFPPHMPASPCWFLAFVASHLVTTLMFYGNWRFHAPLDPVLSLFGVLGLVLVAGELFRYRVLLGSGFTIAIALACAVHMKVVGVPSWWAD